MTRVYQRARGPRHDWNQPPGQQAILEEIYPAHGSKAVAKALAERLGVEVTSDQVINRANNTGLARESCAVADDRRRAIEAGRAARAQRAAREQHARIRAERAAGATVESLAARHGPSPRVVNAVCAGRDLGAALTEAAARPPRPEDFPDYATGRGACAPPPGTPEAHFFGGRYR